MNLRNRLMVKLLMIDNYDSFTYNIIHYLETLEQVTVIVRQPHELEATDFMFDALIISPGPSHPKDRQDTMDFVERYWHSMAILGICLGHQMLWYMTGGAVSRGSRPIHGHVYTIMHDSKALFESLPESFEVTRYHSLEARGENEQFDVVATTGEGINMAIRHRHLPIFGLQYHPEAILSEHGLSQLKLFVGIVKGRNI